MRTKYPAVVGLLEPDTKWTKYKEIAKACAQADVQPPLEVRDYLERHQAGVLVTITDISRASYVATWRDPDTGKEGYMLDIVSIRYLRPNVTHIAMLEMDLCPTATDEHNDAAAPAHEDSRTDEMDS